MSVFWPSSDVEVTQNDPGNVNRLFKMFELREEVIAIMHVGGSVDIGNYPLRAGVEVYEVC